jgi:AAA15 family ATPase/GTPase
MLIEFSVSNFRSIRDRQTLSMVATPKLQHRGNVFDAPVTGEKFPRLLKAAAIYGPNAAGKTSLFKALEAIGLIANLQPGNSLTLPVSAFRFDKLLVNEPSTFEAHFITGGTRYEFHLSATSRRIVREKLITFPHGKEKLLYSRTLSDGIDGDDIYEIGSSLEGGEILHKAWQQLTAPTVLFISQAVANSSESMKQLREPFSWLRSGMMFVDTEMEAWASLTRKITSEVSSVLNTDLVDFLSSVDVPITKIETHTKKGILEADSNEVSGKTTLVHKTELGEATFDYADESRGTQNLIGFWLPWKMLQSEKIERYRTLIIDELDSSLHPKIVELLIKQHINATQPSQLIFTTHDTHLMDAKLLRRDQFWILERDRFGATQMRSVHDFEGREGEDIEKRYYEGRYRGLPIIKESLSDGT